MFQTFFISLKQAGVPVTLREYLTLIEALECNLADRRVESFYYLARTALVKDERHLDRFDRTFATVFKGLESLDESITAEIPEDWLVRMTHRFFSEEERQAMEALGWDKLMQTLRERMAEQREAHQGGSKWIGTSGSAPIGAYGWNPEGIRIGQDKSGARRAVKVWDKREFKDFDDQVELGTRGMKLALRRLRRFAREGAAEELDLPGTIGATARKGYLDVKMRPERRNAIKVLLFLDVGGSMDDHVEACESLFSAARAEFKSLEHFYFHNCLYEYVWKANRRRRSDRIATWDLLHKYPSDYKLVFVGDANMSPYEIVVPGASVEHMNEEPGKVWLERVLATYPSAVWLNPLPEEMWNSGPPEMRGAQAPSVELIRQIFAGRMFPLTLDGLDHAMRELSH